ncbi:MAG: hypothetical protein ACQERR_09525, partial [Pseudomonadota bacterium]
YTMDDNPATDHDSPWKEALEHFFPDFLAPSEGREPCFGWGVRYYWTTSDEMLLLIINLIESRSRVS